MLYKSLVPVVAGFCLRAGTPVTAARITAVLGHLFDADLVEAVCLRMVAEGKLLRVLEGCFTVRTLFPRGTTLEILVSAEYQRLGMTLLAVDHGDWARCIPPAAEHRFLETKPSTIGPAAGLGLFVRGNRRIPLGCILCEYRGRELTHLPSFVVQGIYVVRVRNTGLYIDGVTEDGDHLSLATFINDNGPHSANAGMMEYAKHPGRVFVVANRDIQPGEEVFVLYGATYWGFDSYGELALEGRNKLRPVEGAKPEQRRSNHRKRPRSIGFHSRQDDDNISAFDEGAPMLYEDTARVCRRCGEFCPRRAGKLHSQGCADPLTARTLRSLDCMPFNEFTALDVPSTLLPSRRSKALRRAKSLVQISDPQTFANTHQDVVGDLEFSFEETDDPVTAHPTK